MTDPDRLAEAMMARRGAGPIPVMPYHRLMPRIDPAFLEAYEAWYNQLMIVQRPGGITPEERELAIIAACASARETMGVRLHARKARQMGVPASKIYEAAMLAGLVAGMPAMRDALAVVAEEVPAEALDDRSGHGA